MLHVIAGSSVVDHSTATTTFEDLMEAGGGIGAESEVQSRGGSTPFLIGVDAQEDAEAVTNEVRVRLNTWRSTDYIAFAPRLLTESEGAFDFRKWVGALVPLESDADWEITYESVGGDDHMLALILSYPPLFPTVGGRRIWRKGAVTAADYSTTAAFGTAISITDLDPSKMYRVAGLFGVGGVDCGILRVKAPSFAGQVLQALIPEGRFGGYWFDDDSLPVDGKETISIDASGGAANACEYAICFEEIGQSPGYKNVRPVRMDQNLRLGGSARMMPHGGIRGINDFVQTAGAVKTLFSR